MAVKAKNMHSEVHFPGGEGEQWNEGMLLYSVPSINIFVQQLRFSDKSKSPEGEQALREPCPEPHKEKVYLLLILTFPGRPWCSRRERISRSSRIKCKIFVFVRYGQVFISLCCGL